MSIMLHITLNQSLAVADVLSEASRKITVILGTPCEVLLTSPRLITDDVDLDNFIKRAIAAIHLFTGADLDAIRSPSKRLHVVRARQLLIKVLRESVFKPSYKRIARLVHRDHSTVIYSLRVINNDIERYDSVKKTYDAIVAELQPKANFFITNKKQQQQ